MKLALCQISVQDDIKANENKSCECLIRSAEQGADLILYPEIQLCRFFPQYKGLDMRKFALTRDSEFIRNVRSLCRQYHIMAAPNIYLSENDKYYDATVLISAEGEIIGVQKMVHIAQAERFYEQDYYTESDDGFKVFDTPFGKIGIVVCFDRHYPESIRTQALSGADLILIPTANTASEPSEMFDWEIRVQAFQNSTAVAMCNRTGTEDRMNFCGGSLVVNAEGEIIAKASANEEILYADYDLNQSALIRQRKPYTQLRRTELYK